MKVDHPRFFEPINHDNLFVNKPCFLMVVPVGALVEWCSFLVGVEIHDTAIRNNMIDVKYGTTIIRMPINKVYEMESTVGKRFPDGKEIEGWMI